MRSKRCCSKRASSVVQSSRLRLAEHVSRKREAIAIRPVIPRKRQVPMRPQGFIAATKRRRRNRAASRFATTGITSRASRLATKFGDKVVARNMNPEGHTRVPRYARGKHGVIRHDWGVFVFPDTHAHGQGANPQHCYSVEFDARELWGPDHSVRERIYIDLWEDYLEADRAQRSATPRQKSAPAKKPAPTIKRMSAASTKKGLVRVVKKSGTTKAKKRAVRKR